MAFGFFKKNEFADILFMGGRIFTQDPDLPWAEAVACKDGKVLAVGDFEDLSELEGEDTEVVDLEGGVMLPGFIDTCGHPVLRIFEDVCLILEEGIDLTATLEQIAAYIADGEEKEAFFIFGYDEALLAGHDNDSARALLDGIEAARPVAVLGRSGIHSWFNTPAVETAKAAAEEDKRTHITLPYILSVLSPFNEEVLQEAAIRLAGRYCEKGFTSVFECGAPDYLDGIYQDILVQMFQEDMAKQRFYGSLLVNRAVDPKLALRKLSQKKTNCNELDEYLNCETLKLTVERRGETAIIPREALEALCLEAGDMGFSIHIDAADPASAREAFAALEAVRSAGYRKNTLVLACDEAFLSEELKSLSSGSGILLAPSTLGAFDEAYRCLSAAGTVGEAIDRLTIDAAEQLGVSDRLGRIRRGMYADFAIFAADPLEAPSVRALQRLDCVMTVLNGEIVYDAEEDDMADWYAMFAEQQF